MQKKTAILGSLLMLVVLVGAGCSNRGAEPVNPNKVVIPSESLPTVDTDANASDETASDGGSAMTNDTEPSDVQTGLKTAATLTVADVAKHNTKTDCYIIVRGAVFNVTAAIDQHPGGPGKIIPLCGKDATAAFTGQHGGQETPESALASMKIGELKK